MRLPLAFSACIVAGAAARAATSPAYVVVAKSGDPIAGLPGFTHSLMQAPTISRAGNICVWTLSYNADGSAVEIAAISPASLPPTAIVENQPAGGLTLPWIVNQYRHAPIVTDAGEVLWHATITQPDGSPPFTGASIVGSATSLRAVFAGQVPVVDVEPGWTFRRSGLTSVRFGEAGTATARGMLFDEEQRAIASVIAAEHPEGVRILLNANDQAPGLPDNAPFTAFTQHVMNGVGDVGVANGIGVWLVKPHAVAPVCVRDTWVSLRDISARVIGGFERVSMNDAGEFVFPVDLEDVGRVVLAGGAGDLREVARLDALDPLPNGETLTGFFQGPVISATASVAFVLGAGAKDTYNPAAAFFADRTSLVRIAAHGEHAPGFPEGWKFQEGFSRIEVNARDQVVLAARVTDGVLSKRTIYAWTRGAGLQLLASEQAQIRLVNADSVYSGSLIHLGDTVEESPSTGGEDARARMLADNGQVVFAIMGPALTYYTLTATLPGIGDINADGLISGADLSILLAQYANSVKPGDSGDFNLDGLVNASDLSVLLSALASQN